MPEIKVGICVAYDWPLLEYSLPAVYAHAARIVLSFDRNRTSWSGTPFELDRAALQQLIDRLDPEHKIELLEDDYALPELQPMENEVRQRRLIARHLGPGGWHVQIDCDEIFQDFGQFVRFLKGCDPRRRVDVCAPFIQLFKRIPEGFLAVSPRYFSQIEWMPVATGQPDYRYGRMSPHFYRKCLSPLSHLSWAREPEEILQKVRSWGHSRDFDSARFFSLWSDLNVHNYRELRDFHPNRPEIWPSLVLLPVQNLHALAPALRLHPLLPASRWQLWLANSIWFSRLCSEWRRLRTHFTPREAKSAPAGGIQAEAKAPILRSENGNQL